MIEIAVETSSIFAVWKKFRIGEHLKFLLCVLNPTYGHVKNLCCSEQDFEAPNTFGLVAVF
jgi:hypothetical protein